MSDYLTREDLNKVYVVTFNARTKWRNILLMLKVSSDTIERIGKEWSSNSDDCYREGLLEWLKGGERSWRDIVIAMSSPTVGHSDLASTVEKHHVPPIQVKSDGIPVTQAINKDLIVFLKKRLGKGAFGVVFEGSYKGKICAVKILHHDVMEMLANIPAGKNEEASDAIVRESDFLKSIHHSNVVQFLSTTKHSKSGGTILVVERMDCSLRSYLSGCNEESLTSECEISLSKDMACGLAYIHSKQIIHRDLCGDNILLKRTRPLPVAKIADFGMSRLYDPSKYSRTLTAIGHRMGYLPLEAIRINREKYDNSVDVFSLGVIIVQIICKLETIKSMEDRSFHVSQIPHTHRLRKLIDSCLQEDMRRRPSARDICSDKALNMDSESIAATRNPVQESEDHVRQEPESSLIHVADGGASKVSGDPVIQEPESDSSPVAGGGASNVSGDPVIQEPESDSSPVAGGGASNVSGDPVIQEPESDSSLVAGGGASNVSGDPEPGSSPVNVDPPPRKSRVSRPSLNLKWKEGPAMPTGMSHKVQSVVIGDTVYVGGGKADNYRDNCTVMKLEQDQWTKLPVYAAKYFAMTSLTNRLVLVGGRDPRNKKPTNQLAVLESGEWTLPYPPMKNARHSSTAVSFNNHIIVAGGSDDKSKHISSVEVLEVATRTWYIAQSLPKQLSHMRSTLTEKKHLYLMGGYNFTRNKTVYHIDLKKLISKAKALDLMNKPTLSWESIEDTPLELSAPLSIGKSLLAIGGRDDKNNPKSSIHLYQPESKGWLKVGDLPTTRSNCTCSVLPNGEVIFAGGKTKKESDNDFTKDILYASSLYISH